MRTNDRINTNVRVEEIGDYIYVAKGPVIAELADSIWQVFRVDTSSGTTKQFAKSNGVRTDAFVFPANDLSSLDY